ncbi:DUF1643 domain-containing protein [Paracoccus sp. (in: a-proteobacteria)]|nr:DUF1643 domain-containing protein [Paracoccus sp. (in: a-proteobacteria)]
MIERSFSDRDTHSRALFSECGAYRYALTRRWGRGRRLTLVLLNPSTADERRNDPTVARCEVRARALGFGAFRVTNLFAFRATDPRDLKRALDPVGPDNDAILERSADWADTVLCGWGLHGAHLGRGPAVEARLRQRPRDLCHLGLTGTGAPRHPLYVAYRVMPVPWR